MFLNNLKLAMAVLFMAAAVGLGAGGFLHLAQADQPGDSPTSQPPAADAAGALNDQPVRVEPVANDPAQGTQPHANAAHNAYEVAVRLVQARSSGAKLDDVYIWSVRWLNARRDVSSNNEDRLSALSEHVKRMQQLAQVAAAIAKAGQGSPLDWAATDFYLREAEFWLAKAKAAAKQADK